MFAYEKESSGIKCRYFPHMSLKDKNVLDFFSPTGIYGSQASQCTVESRSPDEIINFECFRISEFSSSLAMRDLEPT